MNFLALIITIPLLAPATSLAASLSYIGDSQSASNKALFVNLKPTLDSNGGVRSGVAVCSAFINDYLAQSQVKGRCRYNGVTSMSVNNGTVTFPKGPGETKPIEKVMDSSRTVIVQLGDNHLDNPSRGAKAAEDLARKILGSGRSCVWIGPAAVSAEGCARSRGRKQKVSEAIKDKLATLNVGGKKCEFVDSFSLTQAKPPKSPDCLHYSNYSQWAGAIHGDLDQAIRRAEAGRVSGADAGEPGPTTK